MSRGVFYGLVTLSMCAALAACGTTVAPANGGTGVAQGTGAQDGLTAPGATGDGSGGSVAGPAGAGTGQVVGQVSGPGGPAAASGGTSGGLTGVPGGSGTGAGAGAHGRAASGFVKLGITYPDAGGLATAVGTDKKSDPQAWYERIVTYINKNGGIAGRQVKATYFKADLAQDSSTLGQQACSAFTEDTKVDLVVNTAILGDTLPACLDKRGVSLLESFFQVT